MLESSSKLTELENLVRRLPPAKRAALLNALTDLFIENIDRYRLAQITLFDRLFNQLIAESATETTATLSRRLAPIANAPIKIVERLAHDDDISIAEPVLMRSPCLGDTTLLEIARTKGQTHLLAIACRPMLVEDVVDLLVTRGDDVVVRYVANNRGARISDAGAAALIERAKSDDALAILVKNRDDIPLHMRGAVSAGAPEMAPAADAVV